MRKAQKQQIEEFLKVLQQAHSEIKKQIEEHYLDETLEILEQCQQGAVQTGELIESIEGEGCITIRLLEGYCEIVYQLYEEISKERTDRINRIYKSLCKYLIKIENSVKNDIKIHKEVVFLPYKASMWDSLESVWQAAEADPDCDAYVIPIPYYDRGTDGSFCEMHYEGNLYPDYVPVIRYENYDFEKRKPDMIFIHNPYDEYNYVTSVAPFFYSGNLKKYTEQLIYIPYFILGEINNPEDPATLDGIAQYCITQGVMNADKVIVQSENMRRAYINLLTRQMGEETKGYWEEKILGLGSPKIDKVLSTRKEDLEIPKEWIKILKKPDGQFKKVIFYNTGVTALLKHEEKLLKKIRDVMKVFKENQDEVALLWRPHPLMFTTLRSMRPQLLREYEEIVAEYREEGWGIYDDTADMDRAICLSDAYYGDWSSIVWLYQAVKKTAILQNINMISNKDIPLSCTDIVRYKEKLFIITSDTKSLFEYDYLSGGMKLCGTIGNNTSQLFCNATLCENKLYMISYEGDIICIYNMQKEEFQRITLNQKYSGKEYFRSFSYQKKIYFLSYRHTVLLCLDTRDNDIKDLSKCFYEFERTYNFKTGVSSLQDVCIVEDCFWVPLEGNNMLMQYDMLSEKFYFWKVGKRIIQYSTISFDGEYFWLSGDQKVIVRWEKKTDEVREYDAFPDGFEICNEKDYKELFHESLVKNGNIYFAPFNCNMLIKINRKTDEMNGVSKIKSENFYYCRIREINSQEIYVEEVDVENQVISSTFVDSDNNCKISSILIESQNNLNSIVVKESLDKQRGIVLENHPQFISTLANILRGKVVSLNSGQRHIGKSIVKTTIE